MTPPSWLWTTRAGYEADLAAELSGASVLGPALVTSDPPADVLPTFARQGFAIGRELVPEVEPASALVRELVPKNALGFALHVWLPDTDAGNRLSDRARTLREGILHALGPLARDERAAHQLFAPTDPLIQIAMLDEARAFAGASPVSEAPSTWPGGRARMRVPDQAPSRSTGKLLEALAWLGYGPEAEDVCVDLGAAPGGWTWVLVQRKARVLAVDRANLAPSLARERRIVHIRKNAFEFAPNEPVDWLFCDMVHRPSDVARLLAKWAERRWARALVANFKLPMKKRVAAVTEIRALLAAGGWKDMKTRQLYHDRDEVTLVARR